MLPATFYYSHFLPYLNSIHSKILEIPRNGYLVPCSKIMVNTSVVLMWNKHYSFTNIGSFNSSDDCNEIQTIIVLNTERTKWRLLVLA